MKPLFVPLKTQYFNAFKSGIKKTEYRLYGPRWHEGTVIKGRPVTLSKGYSGPRLYGVVVRMRKIKNTITDLYPYGAILCAIDITNISKRCRQPVA